MTVTRMTTGDVRTVGHASRRTGSSCPATRRARLCPGADSLDGRAAGQSRRRSTVRSAVADEQVGRAVAVVLVAVDRTLEILDIGLDLVVPPPGPLGVPSPNGLSAKAHELQALRSEGERQDSKPRPPGPQPGWGASAFRLVRDEAVEGALRRYEERGGGRGRWRQGKERSEQENARRSDGPAVAEAAKR